MQTINKGHHPQIPTTTADAMVEGPLKFREPKILNFTNSYNIFQAHSYSPRGRIKVMREIALNKLLFLFRLSIIWFGYILVWFGSASFDP